ncbi:MAG: hypothetical protein JNM95_13775, partial [Chitinophagaceae bacterium]|nr:hypothetical protein [Chitinophagaceae bacterium]
MNKILLTFLLLLLVTSGFAQVINVSNVTTSGRFSQCSGAPIPTIQVSYVSGTGTTFSGGNIICNDPCGTTTVHVVIDSITWQQMPDAEWLHGIFLPANAGYTVSGINLPTGFVTYNNGCQGQCPVGISAGPGFYFDASAGNDCCGTILANDGYPCNNYGKTTLNCVNKFSLDFNLTFCNSILTTPTETFTLSGTSDGATGCWSYFTAANHSISFTVNVTPCTTVYNVPFSATAITRSCSGGIENFTTTLTGGCGNGNSVSWWSAATGGTLLGSGSPFVYDPAGSTCPGGQTIYASCCPGGTTSCIARQAVVIPGTCSSLMITGVNSVSGNCTSPSAINAVSVANSIGTVTYTLSPGNISNTSGIFTGLVLGSYTVTVTDGTNCSATTAVSFTPISVPSLSLSNTTILCNAGTSTLTAVGSGTSIPYQYSLNGGALQSSGVFSGLNAGTYTVVVSDGNNCTSSSTIQITQPNVLTLGLGAGNIGCFGGSTTISGVATGGTMAYSYKLNAGSYQSSNSFTGITAGSYTVTVKDANNCTATSSITITQPTALAVSLSSGSILCNGGSTVLTANASGGTTAYQFSLNGSSYQNGNTFTVSSATYTVSVKDANNCTASSTIIITQPTPIVFGSASTNNVLCNGGSSGEIEILATGGTGTKTYTIAPLGPQTNTDGEFENLTAQCYTITAKDINNCSVTTVVCISQPAALTLTASSTAIACNAGVSTITCVAGGGTPSYQYQLNAGAFQTSSSFANNVAGTYTLTVKDANNCTKSTVLTITQPLALSLSVNASAILCNAGTSVITATAGGGTTAYQYSLNGGTYQSSNTFSGNASSTYTVTVKDANNCTKTSTVAITQPALLQIIGVLGTIPTCIPGNDATLSVSAIGGTGTLQYKINASAYQLSNQFSGLSASTYTITVKDANNCTATTVQAIMAPVLPVISSVSTTPIACFGNNTAQITVAASGMTSLTYQLLPNNVVNSTGVFNGLNAGAYTVVVTDGNSCSATSAVTITQPTLLTATASATAISCNAGQSTITVTANGGTTAYQYKLNAGAYQSSNIFSNNNAGTYTITVQDANNCTTTTTVSIVQPTALTLSASATAILCNPGSSTITATAGGGTTTYQYSLNGGAYQSGNTFSGNGPGTYTITVKDANNCTKTSTVSITQPNVLSVTASAGSILCNGGNTTITATGIGGTISYQFSLNGGTYQAGTSFTNVVAGSYTVTIKDANNCTATTIVTITQPTLLTATASASAISCNAGQSTITVTANGGTTAYQYKLNAGAYQASNIFSNNNAGTYTITVQDANNCTTTTTVSIVQPTALTLSSSATAILCNPGTSTITATASGGTTAYQFSLNGGAYQSGNTFSGNGPGTYTITVKDANNCTKTSTVSITQPNVLNVTASAGSILCNGGNTTITATGTGGTTSYQYSLNGGTYQAGTSFTNVVAGSYTVTIKDANNCTATTIVTITQPTLLTATASATAISCNAGQSTITV